MKKIIITVLVLIIAITSAFAGTRVSGVIMPVVKETFNDVKDSGFGGGVSVGFPWKENVSYYIELDFTRTKTGTTVINPMAFIDYSTSVSDKYPVCLFVGCGAGVLARTDSTNAWTFIPSVGAFAGASYQINEQYTVFAEAMINKGFSKAAKSTTFAPVIGLSVAL